jgi:hypothetical protein
MSDHICSFSEERIVNAAYGDAGVIERFKVYRHRRSCEPCNKLYHGYRRTAQSFKEVKSLSCPPGVTVKAEEKIGLKKKQKASVTDRLLDLVFSRPAVALSGTAVVVLLAFIVTFRIFLFTPAPPPHQFSEREIDEARQQIERTFALVVPVVQNAQKNVQDDIIMSRIVPPLQSGVQKTNQLFRSVQ